jgi:putative ABC transport system permease protein
MATGGIVAGVAIGVFVTRYLQSVLYEVAAFDVKTYLAGALLLLLTAILGAYVPARRSSRVDPLIAVRSE